MKKYITLAALLAAGTAFANAETTLTTWNELDGNKDAKVGGTSGGKSWDVESSGLTWIHDNEQSFFFTVDYRSFSTGENDYLLWSVDDSKYNGLATISISDGNIQFGAFGESNGSVALNTFNNAKSLTFAIDRYANTDATNTKDRLVFNVYKDAAFLTAAYTYTVNGGNKGFGFSGCNWDLIDFGTITNAYNPSTNTAPTTSAEFKLLGAGYTTGGVATTDDLTSYYNSQVVPEPSAFGLLAGIGALALVASRRRRK